jgi:prevent-host-death family protein
LDHDVSALARAVAASRRARERGDSHDWAVAVEKVFQATEANRHFFRILREVAEGDTFTVTSHGRPIARIVPASTKGSKAAKQRLLEHLRSQPAIEIGSFTRQELYDC